MNKKGFSLTEMLLTVGIAGVVAALTIPTLMSNTQNAQIGPKLAKAAAAIEQAHINMLRDMDYPSITEADVIKTHDGYIEALSNYMHVVPYTYGVTPSNTSMGSMTTMVTSNAFESKDGIVYFVSKGYSSSHPPDYSLPAHDRYIGAIYVDINGISKPNAGGTDIFGFALFDDGSLRPAGGTEWKGSTVTDVGTWQTLCPADSVPTTPVACTGHIFENNLKVLYK